MCSIVLSTKSQHGIGKDVISELFGGAMNADKDYPLIFRAGFPTEMQQFLSIQDRSQQSS